MNAPAENVDAQSWSAQLWADNALLGNCPVGRLAIGIATDICRYRSSAGRRRHRLVGHSTAWRHLAHVDHFRVGDDPDGTEQNPTSAVRTWLLRVRSDRSYLVLPWRLCEELPRTLAADDTVASSVANVPI